MACQWFEPASKNLLWEFCSDIVVEDRQSEWSVSVVSSETLRGRGRTAVKENLAPVCCKTWAGRSC